MVKKDIILNFRLSTPTLSPKLLLISVPVQRGVVSSGCPPRAHSLTQGMWKGVCVRG